MLENIKIDKIWHQTSQLISSNLHARWTHPNQLKLRESGYSIYWITDTIHLFDGLLLSNMKLLLPQQRTNQEDLSENNIRGNAHLGSTF